MGQRDARPGPLGRRSAAGVLLLGMMAAGLSLAWKPSGVPEARAQDPPARALRVVVHVNFAQTTRERTGLSNVDNMIKAAAEEGVPIEIEVVCHAEGIRLVEKARTELADEVADLIGRGVRFAACRNTMRQRSITPEGLLPGVVIVPSGAYEVVRRQQDGATYFKP